MDKPKISITAKRRIKKFSEGQNPETDQPYEIIEKDDVYIGEEAEELMKQLGIKGDNNGIVE